MLIIAVLVVGLIVAAVVLVLELRKALQRPPSWLAGLMELRKRLLRAAAAFADEQPRVPPRMLRWCSVAVDYPLYACQVGLEAPTRKVPTRSLVVAKASRPGRLVSLSEYEEAPPLPAKPPPLPPAPPPPAPLFASTELEAVLRGGLDPEASIEIELEDFEETTHPSINLSVAEAAALRDAATAFGRGDSDVPVAGTPRTRGSGANRRPLPSDPGWDKRATQPKATAPLAAFLPPPPKPIDSQTDAEDTAPRRALAG
jgi:hypothetical protein